jgi:hypothetical protein
MADFSLFTNGEACNDYRFALMGGFAPILTYNFTAQLGDYGDHDGGYCE